jgi:hypothetical protein
MDPQHARHFDHAPLKHKVLPLQSGAGVLCFAVTGWTWWMVPKLVPGMTADVITLISA